MTTDIPPQQTSTMMIHVNIGSNLGDRLTLISRAVHGLELAFGTKARMSEPFESEAWGYESAHRFMNVGVNMEIGVMEAERVLEKILEVQNSIDNGEHRDSHGAYADRHIDIDLIAIGALNMGSGGDERLQLPHPRMHLREFVLRPMMELWPGWRHPVTGLTPEEMLERLRQGVTGAPE